MIRTPNDSDSARSTWIWPTLLLLNIISAAIAGYYGLSALLSPETRAGITGPSTDDLTVYASLYGIRSVALAVVLLAVLLIHRRRGSRRLIPLLVLAGAIQACDAVLLLATGSAAMVAGPLVSVIVHLGTAEKLRRDPRINPSVTTEAR